MSNRNTGWKLRVSGIAIVAILLLAAAVPLAEGIPQQPTYNVEAVVIEALNSATGMKFNTSYFTIVGVSQVDWPDDCLGLGGFNADGEVDGSTACAQTKTPGYRITVDALGSRYVIHTDQGANKVRLVPVTLTNQGAGGGASVPVTGGEAQTQATATTAAGGAAQATATTAGGSAVSTATPAAGGAAQATATTAATEAPLATATTAATQAAGQATAQPTQASGQATAQVPVTGGQQAPAAAGAAGMAGFEEGKDFKLITQIMEKLNDELDVQLNKDNIIIVSSTRMTFTDECLGLAVEGKESMEEGTGPDACATAKIDGYRVGVVALGDFYVLHTNESGTEVRMVPVGLTTGAGTAGSYAGMLNTYNPEPIPQTPNFNYEALMMQILNDHFGWNLNIDDLSGLAVSQVNWGDSCLGLGGIDTTNIGNVDACAPVRTPGYRIQANVMGSLFVVHTNKDASQVRLVPPGLTTGGGGGGSAPAPTATPGS